MPGFHQHQEINNMIGSEFIQWDDRAEPNQEELIHTGYLGNRGKHPPVRLEAASELQVVEPQALILGYIYTQAWCAAAHVSCNGSWQECKSNSQML